MSSISVHENQGPKNETSILVKIGAISDTHSLKFESFVFKCSIGFK